MFKGKLSVSQVFFQMDRAKKAVSVVFSGQLFPVKKSKKLLFI